MASLGLVRRLPWPIRRVIIRAVDVLRAFLEQRSPGDPSQQLDLPRKTDRRYSGTRVAVVGFFGVRCGLQRGAQLMVLELRARNVEVMAFDITRALNTDPNQTTTAETSIARLVAWRPTDVIIHINPPEFARALMLFPQNFLSDTCIVAYWAWELTVISNDWRRNAELPNEIWTPSPFVADTLASELPEFGGPIQVVPHAVDRDPMPRAPPETRKELRERFDLRPDRFVVGTSFSFGSNYARKNPCAAIDAFRRAFRHRDGESAQLIIRCADVANHRHLFDHLLSYAACDDRILIWTNGTCRINEFYGLLDVYISLHRSEGYGLTLAEAAQAGVAVLATGWGLAPDIAVRPQVRQIGFRLVTTLDPQGFYHRPGAVWAEPDLDEAALGLRGVFDEWVVSRRHIRPATRLPGVAA
jgi:glycosyltransferase involved in cell wall biosynthesis